MKILILNQDWFIEEFRALGHEVRCCGTGHHLEVVLPTPCLHIHTILKEHLGGFEPDLILWLDNSAPMFTMGFDEIDIPTIFYSVDTHHHHHVHRFLAHVFDLTFIAQKDYLHEFHNVGADAYWLPLWASRYVEPSAQKEHGAVFVGTLNAKLNPERVRFFEALQEEVPVLTMTGEFWKIFPFSELVINQTVKGDLNFRVFEAMMCGTLLLTEYAPNGLLDLFEDGVHLLTYEKNNVKEAAEKIRQCLADLSATRRIAQCGREEVLKKHLPQHRADAILEAASRLEKRHSNMKCFSNALSFSILSRSIEALDGGSTARSLIAAVKSLEQGLREQEIMNDSLALEAIYACLRYDQLFSSGGGSLLLGQLSDAYPDTPSFALAQIRQLLNQGNIDQARALSEKAFAEPCSKTFGEAEKFVTAILSSSDTLKGQL